MDRNTISRCINFFEKLVALRKESVDRNFLRSLCATFRLMSLSARRAWIEIEKIRKKKGFTKSLSARRAWIEIARRSRPDPAGVVALRKESVDRNRAS